jgi:hypothetical protein
MARAKNKIGNRLDSRRKKFCIQRNKKILHSAIGAVYPSDSADVPSGGPRRLPQATQKMAASIKMETAIWL